MQVSDGTCKPTGVTPFVLPQQQNLVTDSRCLLVLARQLATKKCAACTEMILRAMQSVLVGMVGQQQPS